MSALAIWHAKFVSAQDFKVTIDSDGHMD